MKWRSQKRLIRPLPERVNWHLQGGTPRNEKKALQVPISLGVWALFETFLLVTSISYLDVKFCNPRPYSSNLIVTIMWPVVWSLAAYYVTLGAVFNYSTPIFRGLLLSDVTALQAVLCGRLIVICSRKIFSLAEYYLNIFQKRIAESSKYFLKKDT